MLPALIAKVKMAFGKWLQASANAVSLHGAIHLLTQGPMILTTPLT